MDNVVNLFSIIIFLFCWFLIIKKLFWSRIAPVKTVKAEVFDKYKPDTVSNYPGTVNQESYVVVFKAKDKKLSFNVSGFSYNNYRIGEEGTLKYKGNRMMSFK